MRARSALFAVVWLGVIQPDYESCACGELPDEPRPLPMGEIECDDDLDCTGDPCEVGRCWAGTCMFRPVVDRDLDGAFPPPCGGDCNDRESAIGPGAAEVCNLADDDCDGAADEGAPPGNLSALISTDFVSSSVLLPSDEGALVVRATDMRLRLFAHYVGLDGPDARPFDLAPYAGGGLLTGSRSTDGTYVAIVYATSPQYTLFERSAAGFTITRSSSPLPRLDGMVPGDLHMIPFGGSVALAYDTTTRNVRVGLDGPDVVIGDLITLNGVAIATDGVDLAVLDPAEDTVVFLDASGTVVARHSVPATVSTRAIASGDGVVYVATTDGSMSWLTPVSRTGGAAASVLLRGGGVPRIAFVDGLVVVAIDASLGSWEVGVIDPATGTPRGDLLSLSAGHRLYATRVADGIAVSAGLAEVGFLGACGDLF